jgi:hypothetical protein
MEEKYGPKTGPKKMAEAVTLFYKYIMPDNFEKLLPGTTLGKFLQDTFDNGYGKIKDLLDDGFINGSVKTAVQEAPKVINPTGQITNIEKL